MAPWPCTWHYLLKYFRTIDLQSVINFFVNNMITHFVVYTEYASVYKAVASLQTAICLNACLPRKSQRICLHWRPKMSKNIFHCLNYRSKISKRRHIRVRLLFFNLKIRVIKTTWQPAKLCWWTCYFPCGRVHYFYRWITIVVSRIWHIFDISWTTIQQ